MGAALGAVPFTLVQAKTRDPVAAEAAGLCSRFPAADLDNLNTFRAGDMLQDGYKLGKAQVRNLAAPEAFHSVQVEILDTDDGKFIGQLVCQNGDELSLQRVLLIPRLQHSFFTTAFTAPDFLTVLIDR